MLSEQLLSTFLGVGNFCKIHDAHSHEGASLWERDFYHWIGMPYNELRSTADRLPRHVLLWVPGLPLPFDVVADKDQVGNTITATSACLV